MTLNFIFATLRKSYFVNLFSNPTFKSIIIFLFVVFLPITPDSQISVSQVSASLNENTVGVLNQQQFGIAFSPSIFFLGLLVIILFFEVFKKKASLKFQSHEIYLLIFFIISEISVIYSIYPKTSFVWLLKLTYGILVYLVFSRIKLNKSEFFLIIKAFLVTAYFEAILAILQSINLGLLGIPFIENLKKVGQSTVTFYSNTGSFFRSVGTFSHPNIFSSYASMLIPAFLLLSLSHKHLKKLFIYLGLFSTIIIVILTFSRGGVFIGIFSATISLLFYQNFINNKVKIKNILFKNRLIHLSAIILLMLLLVSFTNNPLLKNRFTLVPQNNINTRIETLKEGFYIFKNYPLGIGGGAAPIFLVNYDYTATNLSTYFVGSPHNFYLLMITEIGILGLICILLMIYKIIKSVLENINTFSYDYKIIILSFFIPLLVFLFNGLWQPWAFTNRLGLLFFLDLGLLVNVLNFKNEKKI